MTHYRTTKRATSELGLRTKPEWLLREIRRHAVSVKDMILVVAIDEILYPLESAT